MRSGLLLALELGLALLPAWLLLAGYLGPFVGPGSAALPHLQLVLLTLIAPWLGLRLLLPCSHRAWARWSLAGTAALIWLGWLAYAILVLVGLKAWGRVVTWVLIETYVADLSGLLAVLGVGSWQPLLGAAVLLLAVAALLARYLRSDPLAQRAAGSGRRAVGLGLIVLAPAQLALFVQQPAVSAGEPLALTFFSERLAQAFQSHPRNDARLLDRQAEQAAAAYRPRDGGAERPSNIVLIVVDALRADALKLDQRSRPADFALAGEFAGAQRLAAWTMWSGCAESSCGLLGMARSRSLHQMSDHDLSLMEVLRRHGYRVRMLLSGDHTNFYGLRRAYGQLDSYQDATQFPSYYINDDRLVLDELARWPRWDRQPLMLQLHLMSAHPLGLRIEGWAGQRKPVANYASPIWRKQAGGTDAAGRNYYANGVEQLGRVIEQALRTLADKGYLDDALVVVTGDHGESLGEHGEFSHAQGVHEPALKVPFLLLRYGPAQAPMVPLAAPDSLVSQLDLSPTLADLVGVPAPASWQGRSWARSDVGPRAWLPFEQGRWVGTYDLRTPGKAYKYVRDLASGRERAHEVLADPDERQELIATAHPEATSRLAAWRKAVAPLLAARAH